MRRDKGDKVRQKKRRKVGLMMNNAKEEGGRMEGKGGREGEALHEHGVRVFWLGLG